MGSDFLNHHMAVEFFGCQDERRISINLTFSVQFVATNYSSDVICVETLRRYIDTVEKRSVLSNLPWMRANINNHIATLASNVIPRYTLPGPICHPTAFLLNRQ